MDTKRTILITTLSLMILAVFIFRQSILKLDDIQILVGSGVAIIVIAIITGYVVQDKFKKVGIKEIPIDKKGWFFLIVYIAYPATIIIFAAIGMESIAGWMGSLGFIALGGYTIYFSKQIISKGKINSIFGNYDKKKNYTAFKIMITIYIILGILEIGFGIFVLTALL